MVLCRPRGYWTVLHRKPESLEPESIRSRRTTTGNSDETSKTQETEMRFMLVLLLALTGCQTVTAQAATEYPTVNVPFGLRQSNWRGSQGEGSCVHASMISLMRWQGRINTAKWWRDHNGNGEWDTDLAAKFDRAGIRYAFTSDCGDVSFLEWACKTRRGCGVTVMGGCHMVALIHLDDRWAGLLDNNHTGKFIWVPRETFLSEWKNSGSWAIVPIYTPAPPMP